MSQAYLHYSAQANKEATIQQATHFRFLFLQSNLYIKSFYLSTLLIMFTYIQLCISHHSRLIFMRSSFRHFATNLCFSRNKDLSVP